MKLIIGVDHNAVEIKKELIERLKPEFEIVDCGLKNEPYDDYPDFAFKVGNSVLESDGSFGILICGTGIGMSIAANKVKGIRCALVTSGRAARLARRDDDANVIALDSMMDISVIEECIRIFVNTPFCTEKERYQRRKNKVIDYENGAYDEL